MSFGFYKDQSSNSEDIEQERKAEAIGYYSNQRGHVKSQN